MSEPENPPAFPVSANFLDVGMTLRDWFAGQALVGLLSGMIASGSNANVQTDDGILLVPLRKAAAPLAFEYADAMLTERSK